MAALFLCRCLCAGGQPDLQQIFSNPPQSAKPWAYWFWINGNITREGITSDLEAMAKAGIGGVLIMEVANPKTMAPTGPVPFAGSEWRELFKHVVSEASRLGLEVNMNNDAGWCGSGGPWVQPEYSMQKLTSTTTSVTGPQQFHGVLPRPEALRDYYKDVSVIAFPATKTNAGAISPESLIDLKPRMKEDGTLQWDTPPGDWLVMRIGVTTTGVMNKPSPVSGQGLECDKLDKEALKRHFNSFIDVLADDVGPASGKAFSMTHIDSWEVGTQNWTARMPREFRKRRGYDLEPWLPVLAGGYTVAGTEQTRRFLRDYKRTCAELLLQNYAGALRDLAHSRKLKLSIEAYGTAGFLNPLEYAAECDLPMAEFWICRWGAWHLWSSRTMASAAHFYGKPIVGAEAFTSWAESDPYTEHPYSVKTIGDWAMCEGINRMVFHRSVLQPWNRYVPGMSFAGYGWHVDRLQTWWEDFSGYLSYLAHCQALLQQGTFAADVCRLVPDGENFGNSPNMSRLPGLFDPLPVGYAFDYISDRALAQLAVKNGRLTAKSGMTYSMLQVPRTNQFAPELMKTLARLVKEGAVISGGRPTQSPSLQDFPHCDEEVQKLANQLWGNCDGVTLTENTFGKGRVAFGEPLDGLLHKVTGGPDFRFVVDPPMSDESIMSVTQGRGIKRGKEPLGLMPTDGLNWIHRRAGKADIYFVANPQHRSVRALCEFRIKGMQPEIWDPMTGQMSVAQVFRTTPSGTVVPMSFDPAGALFVVFREKADPATSIVEIRNATQLLFGEGMDKPCSMPDIRRDGGRLTVRSDEPGSFSALFGNGSRQTFVCAKSPSPITITGPWDVRFQAKRGAPDHAEFAQLADWSTNNDPGIRYFSGSATYKKVFNWHPGEKGQEWNLDLGEVQVMAHVKLNGSDVGIAWKPPYRLNITRALKPGQNELEVKVTNLWPNRLIGDEQFPDDCTPDGSWNTGKIPAWPDWVLKNLPRPEPRRVTFTTWKHFTKDAPLLPSGLLGPVTLQAVAP